MSSVDQALIRLHQRRNAPPPAPPDLTSHVGLVTSPAHIISAVALPSGSRFSNAQLESLEILAVTEWRIDSPAATLAGPHFQLAAKAAAAAKVSAVVAKAEPIDVLTPPVDPVLPPAPEASVVATPAASEPVLHATTTPEHDKPSADAAWSVDHFQLSETCTRLLKRTGAKLAALCVRLSGAADVSQRVVMLTSATRGEGRTTLAICFAEMAARRGLRVALVDGDLDCPALARELGLATECNWAKGLRRGAPLAESCVRSTANKLTVVPLAERIAAADMPSPREVADMLRRLAADHDLVLVDAPPLAPSEVGLAAAGSAETAGRAILVRDVRRNDEDDLSQLVAQLEGAGLAPQGVIENFSKT